MSEMGFSADRIGDNAHLLKGTKLNGGRLEALDHPSSPLERCCSPSMVRGR